jgi:hypothetical protein
MRLILLRVEKAKHQREKDYTVGNFTGERMPEQIGWNCCYPGMFACKGE